MAISWTLIVLGTLLQGMQCNANDNSTTASFGTTSPTTVDTTTADSTKTTVPPITSSSTKPTISAASLESTTLATTLTSLEPNKSAAPPAPSESTAPPRTKATSTELTVPSSTELTVPSSTELTVPSSTVAKQDLASNPSSPNGLVTTQITTVQSKTQNADTTLIAFNNSPQNSPTTVITTVPNQVTTKPAATTDGTTQLLSTQTNPSAFATNSALPSTTASDSKSTASQSFGTTKAQTTTATITPSLPNAKHITTAISTLQKTFNFSFDLSNSTEGNIVYQACKTLDQKIKGNCSVTVQIQDKRLIATVTIYVDQPLEPVSAVTDKNTFQKGNINQDTISDTLIAILASCGALVLILCCFAAYCTYHRRSYRKNQQHLTEELQTVENGYHDNPTLEVMEVQPEMQEKKLTMNGEFNDSWIVPIDNLLKEDIPDEEDTHL